MPGGVRYVDLQLAAEAISAGDSPLTRMATGYRGRAGLLGELELLA